MYTTTVQQEYEECYARTVFNNGYYYYYLLPELGTFSSNDSILLVNKLAAQVKGHQFNLGVTGAEGLKTLEMVTHTIHRVHKAVRAVKHGRFDLALRALGAADGMKNRRAARALTSKDVSSTWLELQYGWMPLFQDVHSGMEAYAAIADKPRKKTYHATLSRTFGRPDVKAYDFYGRFLFTHSSTQMIKRKLTIEVVEDVTLSSSLGLLNPLSVAWELMPFSFVADWFIPIGDYLEAKAGFPNVTGRFLQSTHDIRTTKCIGNPLVNFAAGWDGTLCGYNDRRDFHGSTYSGSSHAFSRTLPDNLFVPLPSFKPLSSAFSGGHIKNAIALLHQAVS